MNFRARLPALLAPAVLVAGCAGPSQPQAARDAPAFATTVSPGERGSGSAVPAGPPPGGRSDAIKLEAFEVKESAFSDFGMSVKTNLEVKWGGSVEWMQVSGVDAASSASSAGLVAGDRILAIDGRSVADMNRDGMLNALFARKKGEPARMLVLGRKEALPHFVRLVASPPPPPSHG